MMLEAVAIQKNYQHSSRTVPVLKGIDLSIAQGDILAIVGPSGAGKSTLLHILGGLDRPSQGRVSFEGEDIYRFNDTRLAKFRNQNIGFIFQFYHLLPEFTALENVILPGMIEKRRGVTGQDLKARGTELLVRVGLAERQSHKPQELSGGEQQRVAIARALFNEPRLIFCDEPTGNLDSETGQSIIRLLLELNQKNRQALVIVTHDENIARIAKTIIHLKDGKIMP